MELEVILERVQVICTNAASQDVVMDKLTPGKVYTWHEITGINRTGGTTTIEVGLKRGGEFFCFRAGPAALVDRSIRAFSLGMGLGECVPCARFKGATLLDLLELVANGHSGHMCP